jgi:hypothetical protein
MGTSDRNEAVKARFARLLARTVRRARVTRVLADSPTFRVPRPDGAGVLSLDDVGPPGEPCCGSCGSKTREQAGEPVDLTDRTENDALKVIVTAE